MRPLTTESEWLRSSDPERLLRHVKKSHADRTSAGRRKLRLFACACCRRGWDYLHLEPEIRDCIEFAESFADGEGTKDELKRSGNECTVRYNTARRELGEDGPIATLAYAARSTCDPVANPLRSGVYNSVGWALGGEPAFDYPAQAALLRCIFGNPFRPVAFDPRWRTETAVALATGIYADRAFDRMPIVADALEEAGCDQPDVLTHCRQPDGPHARGCWVVDGVLGKA